MHEDYGVSVAQRWLQNWQPAEINALVADANSSDQVRRSAGRAALRGAFCQIAATLGAIEKSDVRFRAPIPSVEAVSYAFAVGEPDFSKVGQQLIDSATALHRDLPGLSISWPDPVEPTPRASDDQQQQPAGPLEVKIISLPERVTTTEVTRDKSDNIASTKQTERDAA